ncbi:MAG: tyrosine-type recombinase/integrase [Alphaproteobacteria bacterium]
MAKHHPQNERIKRRYMVYLKEAKRLAEPTIDQAAAAIAAFEVSTNFKDFKRFHVEQARKFKRELADAINPKTGKPLASATVHSRLMAVKTFFQWLADQPGYKSKIGYSDAEYFNPSAKDSRIAKTSRERPAPTLAQIRQVLEQMPTQTAIERRDRALIAFSLLSGARDNAIASLSLKHIDLPARAICQDAREVRTKRAKTINSTFFPVGEDVEAIVTAWVRELEGDHGFGPEDPLFPQTNVGLGPEGVFAPLGLGRKHWADAAPIRRIFKRAFEGADLPYFNPHSFRSTLAQLGEQLCTTPEEFKAWSQNLGHEQVLTTFTSYGNVRADRQAEILGTLAKPHEDLGKADIAIAIEVLQKLKVR